MFCFPTSGGTNRVTVELNSIAESPSKEKKNNACLENLESRGKIRYSWPFQMPFQDFLRIRLKTKPVVSENSCFRAVTIPFVRCQILGDGLVALARQEPWGTRLRLGRIEQAFRNGPLATTSAAVEPTPQGAGQRAGTGTGALLEKLDQVRVLVVGRRSADLDVPTNESGAAPLWM